MREGRVLTREIRPADGYLYPLTTTLLTATTQGTAESLGTVRESSLGRVSRLFVGNHMAVAVALTFYAIPSGGTIGAGNREIDAMSIPGNSNVDLTDLIAGLYAPGVEFKAFAGVSSALIIGGYVRSEF